MSNRTQLDRAGLIFLAGSSLMMAHQVAGKAVRDGLFLSRFAPSELPKIVALAAVVAVILGLGFSRVLARVGPSRLVPAAFIAGAMLHVVEYVLLHGSSRAVRDVVISVVYLHLVALGAILLSGFWSIVNEHFDPREAKLRFGRIAGAGTIGGIVGGLLAERGASLFGPDALLLMLAALHLATGLTLWCAPREARVAGARTEAEPGWSAARDAFRQAPFLIHLAVLVLLGTISAALLDYLFKSGAAAEFGKGSALTRYFAVFYTASQILSFAVQSFLTPAALRRLGLGRTVRWHPVAVACGAGAALFGPQAVMMPLARGLELVLRGSFLRSGYELFFTPIPPREKRAVKTFIDVGCDRLGDAFGAAILQTLLLLGAEQAVKPILVAAVAFAAAGIWITSRMDAAYAENLERGLLSRAVAVDEADVEDSTTLNTLLRTSLLSVKTTVPAEVQAQTDLAVAPSLAAHDPVLARLEDLRSRDPARVSAALAPNLPFDAVLVPQAIRLLAWNEAYEWARAFLLVHAHRAVGQLVDWLLDTEEDFAVRRRIPRILAYTNSQRAVNGLVSALDDSRFEIRYHAGRALEFLHRMGDELQFPADVVRAVVERELSIPKPMWEGRKLLDSRDGIDDQYWFLDDVLKDRAEKSVEHVFSLLALLLPGEPLKVAFRALHSDDRMLRGLAWEYLEGNLSSELVGQLAALLETAPSPKPEARRAPRQVEEDLMASRQSVLLSLRSPSADAPVQENSPRRATSG